ncbi:DUF6985 domain-containing protein [Methylobacterium soli]|uniref:DUF6985 domain-containing protein n=1 Tax=Methylobacterium soli TaxID=553447 RepID=A0A6L3SWG9_9HYPH|nr:hypothetical protein [Methylobacterium soli]KAB1078147.1 hypothetical protein F6X53_15355 [Methylobacterium soli]GJE41428.1 hypothetical protein AEGHOMDF_0594 [Methylobacterium soli]
MEAEPGVATLPAALRKRLRYAGDDLEIGLSSWAGLFGAARDAEPGWLRLGRPENGVAFTAAGIAALAGLAAEQDAVGRAIVAAVALAMPRIGDVLGLVEGDETILLPEPDEIGPALVPLRVRVHDPGPQGGHAALLGIAFACPWDPEHGLGVLLRTSEVLGVDTAEAVLSRPVAEAAAQGRHAFFLSCRPVAPARRRR